MPRESPPSRDHRCSHPYLTSQHPRPGPPPQEPEPEQVMSTSLALPKFSPPPDQPGVWDSDDEEQQDILEESIHDAR